MEALLHLGSPVLDSKTNKQTKLHFPLSTMAGLARDVHMAKCWQMGLLEVVFQRQKPRLPVPPALPGYID